MDYNNSSRRFRSWGSRVMAFLNYKNKNFKKSKNWDFSKGVSPWFWSKIGIFFRFFFLGKIDQKNIFYDILEGGNVFLDYKNKKLKKSKNWDCYKGVSPWFRSKIGNLSRFFFAGGGWGNRRRKMCLRYSRRKKRLSKLWKQIFKTSINWDFYMVLVKNW